MTNRDLAGPWIFHGTARHDGRDAWIWQNPQGHSLLVVPAYTQAPGKLTAMTLVGHVLEPYHIDGKIRLNINPVPLIARVHLPYPAEDEIPGLLDRLLDHQRPERTQAAYAALKAAAEAWSLATMSLWTERFSSGRITLSLLDGTWLLEISSGSTKERPKIRRLPEAIINFFRPIDVRPITVFPKPPKRAQTAHDRLATAAWVKHAQERLLAAFDAADWAPKEALRRQLLKDLRSLERWTR